MKSIKKIISSLQTGDTIVEVLLAIAIASFAIGISYATAQRSLNQSVTAREHNEALNELENQVTDLKLRFQNSSPTDFNNNFASKDHFCLNDASTGSTDTVNQWTAYSNYSGVAEGSPLSASATPDATNPYYFDSANNTGCMHQRTGDGVQYFVDISTACSTGCSTATSNPTLYQVVVRWEKAGGGQPNQASLFYKLDGGNSSTLGLSTVGGSGGGGGGILPPPSGTIGTNLTITSDMNFPTLSYTQKISPKLTVVVNGITVLTDYDFGYGTSADLCNNPVGGYTSFNPTYGVPEDILGETCRDVNFDVPVPGSIPLSSITSVQFIFTTDNNSCEPGHYNAANSTGCDDNYFMDNNIIIHNVAIAGKTVSYSSYTPFGPNLGAPGEPPPPGNSMPFSLWVNWGTPTVPGVVTFNVN